MKRLIRGVTSNNHGDYFRRNCMHSYRIEKALKKHEDYELIMITVKQ